MTDSATILAKCPHCGNAIKVWRVWGPDGVNETGGFALECDQCQRHFQLEVGRDIQISRVVKGARVLDTFDDNLAGDKEKVLERHGIAL